MFGRCKVKWQIDNFSLQTFIKDWFIQSPEFTINGSEDTNWCMNLRSELINQDNCLMFSLKRSAVDSGPKYTWLDLIVVCIHTDIKLVSCKNLSKVLLMKNGSMYEESLGKIEYLLQKMNRIEDSFTIFCHMIVYSNSEKRVLGECNDAGLRLLSENMLDLYRSSQNFDTQLVFDDNVILTHRAVLCSRNDYLCSKITEVDRERLIINFLERLDYGAMRKILAYMYTGDIRHVLQEPSFAIYFCSSFLKISEIKTYYEPDELVLKSTIDFHEYTYVVQGYNFEISDLIWHVDTSTKSYRLLFYSKSKNKVHCFPLFAKTFEKPMIARFRFDLDIVDTSVDCCILTDTTILIPINTIKKCIRNMYSSHKIFKVIIKLKLTAAMKKNSYIGEHSRVFASHIDEDFYYERLSADLNFLLRMGHVTDIRIGNSVTFLAVHKCILASRSHFFSDMFTNEGGTTFLTSIDGHILFIILIYIYTGFLSVEVDDHIIDVYKVAVSLKLPQLESMCSDWLKQSFKINKNIRCRVMRIAEKYEDSNLLKSALNSLFDGEDIVLTFNHLSLQDVRACRHCR